MKGIVFALILDKLCLFTYRPQVRDRNLLQYLMEACGVQWDKLCDHSCPTEECTHGPNATISL